MPLSNEHQWSICIPQQWRDHRYQRLSVPATTTLAAATLALTTSAALATAALALTTAAALAAFRRRHVLFHRWRRLVSCASRPTGRHLAQRD